MHPKEPYIYKFRDTVDGNHIFILATSEEAAREKAETITSIELRFVEKRKAAELPPFVVFNNVLPF